MKHTSSKPVPTIVRICLRDSAHPFPGRLLAKRHLKLNAEDRAHLALHDLNEARRAEYADANRRRLEDDLEYVTDILANA